MSKTKQFLEKILKESDEVPYCDDVNCEPVKESVINKIYQYEVGILLDKDNEEYNSYNMVWDKQHGFYNEDWGVELDLDRAKKFVQNYVNDGVINTYGIISEISVSNEEFVDIQKNIKDNGYFETSNYEADYSVDNVIYSLYKSDDGIVENFIDKNNIQLEESVEENNLDSDPKFYEYVKSLLDVGSIDDPAYYESLSDEEKEDLIRNTWMKDPDIISDYKNYVLEESEEIYKIEQKDSGTPKTELVKILKYNKDTVKVKSIYDDYEFEYDKKFFDSNKQKVTEKDIKNYKFELNEDKEQPQEEIQTEQPQEEPVNDFEALSPEVQNKLNEMSSNNAMYKWVIDDVIDSDIEGYNGDTMDEKLRSRLNEIMDHGCESGTVNSLIYYTDTVKFFDNFNDEIYDMIDDVYGANSVLEMLQQHCELIDIIMGTDTVKNYLAWMAYEVTCSNILDSIESM